MSELTPPCVLLQENSISSLLRYRLRWFALSTARLLLRRWQAVALIVGLSASASTTVLDNMEMLAYPVLTLLSSDHGAVARGVHMVALLAVCGLWAGMQRVQIEGGPFMAFVGALPFSPRQLRRVSIAVLLLADGPLLFLAGWAVVSTVVHRAPVAQPVLLGVLVLLALAAQVAVLERRHRDLLMVAGAGLVVACCLSMPSAVALIIELLVATGAAVALWYGPRCRACTVAALPARAALVVPTGRRGARSGATWLRALQLSFLIVCRERRNETGGKALLAAGLVAGAWGLARIFDGDARSLGTILIAQGLVALTMGGMFRYLHLTHRASCGFTGALPLAANWWRPFDLVVVAALGLPFLACLAAIAWYLGAVTPGLAAATVLSGTLLLGALSLPHLFTDRHAVVLGTIATGLWIAAMIGGLT
jgi:hypothetical protein